MVFRSLFSLFLIVAIAHNASGYSSGAPDDACADMVPQHHVDPQTSQAPYTLTLSRKAIRSGDEVQLTITGKTQNDKIKGFLIQARNGDKPVGSFRVSPNDSFLQTVDCLGGNKNAVTHQKHDEKDDKRTITATWVSPRDYKGDITFRATIALNGGVFWVGVPSETLKIH